jgi:hypothetical protein
MAVLTPQQAEQLSNALVNAFDPTTLPWLVRLSLGSQLYVNVTVQQPFAGVVADLLGWLERQGPGALEALLRGAVAARPNKEQLREFCRQYFPNVLTARDTSSLVHSFNLGVQLLIEMQDQPAVRETVGAFRADLATTGKQIVILKKYKALHDGLHELQIDLDAIEDALERFKTNIGAIRSLRMYAIALQRYADTSRAQASGLATEAEEIDWIDNFDSCIRDINSAAKPNAKPEDRAMIDGVLDRLKNLLPNARRINSLLVNAASTLRLDSFTKTLVIIADRLKGFAAPDDTTIKLIESAKSVDVLRARIDGLVGEHNAWQVFNINLNVAEENYTKHQPASRMPKWLQFKSDLTGLCNAYPDTNWSHELVKRMGDWITATPSAAPAVDEKANGEIAFADFHRACVYRYYDVDKELNELCEQVINVSQPIETLLTAIR